MPRPAGSDVGQQFHPGAGEGGLDRGEVADQFGVLGGQAGGFTRVYSRPGGLRGTVGFFGSVLGEGDEISGLVDHNRLTMPVLAIDGGTGDFTRDTFTRIADDVTTVKLDGIGHLVAIEAPERLATTLLGFHCRLGAGARQ